MRKPVIAFFVFALMLSGISTAAYAGDCFSDSPINAVGDFFATIGKKEVTKNRILAARKADRVTACAQKQVEKAAKTAQKANRDMAKKFGF